jgi:hypothetical protein
VRPLTGPLPIPLMIYEDGEPRWNNNDRGTKELGEKPVPVPLFSPKISHGLTRMRMRASVVSGRPVTAEARFRARVSPCAMCGGQSGTRTGFFSSSSVFSSKYNSAVASHNHVSPEG